MAHRLSGIETPITKFSICSLWSSQIQRMRKPERRVNDLSTQVKTLQPGLNRKVLVHSDIRKAIPNNRVRNKMATGRKKGVLVLRFRL